MVARISWLAPDMISAILDGSQPPQLTGRRLIRAMPSRSTGHRSARCSGSPELRTPSRQPKIGPLRYGPLLAHHRHRQTVSGGQQQNERREEPRKTAADPCAFARDIGDRQFNGLRGAAYRTRTCDPRITKASYGFEKRVSCQLDSSRMLLETGTYPRSTQTGLSARDPSFLAKVL